MLAIALIVFRETLEAALFVGIIAAATRGMDARWRWLGGGVTAGAIGALVLALLAEQIAALADGLGQDYVNVAILALALAMLTWHGIWGQRHGREAAQHAKQVGRAVRAGTRAPAVLALVCGLAVLREGAEAVLFVIGMTGADSGGRQAAVLGPALGLLAGASVGVLIYLGLSRVPAHRLFAVTNTMIVVLAAAIASQLARALAQAGLVQTWTTPLWDSSAWLAPDSPLGSLLHALAGYDARPSGLQLLCYVGTLALITLTARRVQARPSRPASGQSLARPSA
jgi:high-affinity iron transporter